MKSKLSCWRSIRTKSAFRLGIKQLDGDPFNSYAATHEKGSVVKGVVESLDAKGAVVVIDGDVEGYLRAPKCRVIASKIFVPISKKATKSK